MQVVTYAEDEFECRRVSMLSYFGEKNFDRSQCRGTCDNCAKERRWRRRGRGLRLSAASPPPLPLCL